MESISSSAVDKNSWYLACPDCDLLMPKVRPISGHKTECPRCGKVLLRHCSETLSRSLALSLTGLLLYFPALLLPLLTFSQLGLSESGNILQTIQLFFTREYYFVAMATLFSIVIFPLVKLSLLTTVSFFLKLKRYPPFLGKLFRMYNHLEEWAMSEVYLLGIMITIIKMYDSTEINFGTGFFCFVGLVVLTMASSLTVCKESFWNLIEFRGKDIFQNYRDKWSPAENRVDQTAAENNLLLCRECGRLSQIDSDSSSKRKCVRCGATLHIRKPGSVQRTWALILAAAIFIFPANVLPIMRVEFLGIPSNSTILDGIKIFFQDGSYIIALIILTASILIPIFKIVGLAIALITIQFNRAVHLKQKTVMFRCIEFIGRWSMLDIFVIALLGFFINFGFLTSIETAPAATYFCLVVISTMFAALTFDPRIMWDLLKTQPESQSS